MHLSPHLHSCGIQALYHSLPLLSECIQQSILEWSPINSFPHWENSRKEVVTHPHPVTQLLHIGEAELYRTIQALH